MKKLIVLVLFVMCMSFQIIASAAFKDNPDNWVLMFDGPELDWYASINSCRKVIEEYDKNVVEMWFGMYSHKDGTEEVVKERIDLDKETRTLLAGTIYDKNGKVIKNYTIKFQEENYITPGTVGEAKLIWIRQLQRFARESKQTKKN